MSFVPGTRLGPYEIVSPLGAGGMGEVYRARDTRLDRTVAIKVLPEHLAGNPELRQRFEREARAVSSLNHPHICILHDIGSHNGIDYMVMEYLEGETLAARLAAGPLPLDQALRHAIAIADALAQAHRKSVFHRDLKPGNIMLTKSGAKLLDFGLAKVGPNGTSAESWSAQPTAAEPLTREGTILGTFQYMAPEQLEGKPADARTDLFAFGAVLYEMVTGRRAFEGRSQASVMSAILTSHPPPIVTVQPLTPPALDHLVTGCLVKDPDERRQSAADLRRDLEWIASAPAVPAAAAAMGQRRREWIAWAVAAALLLVVALMMIPRGRETPGAPQTARFLIYPPEGTVFAGPNSTVPATELAISPDGRRLVFVAGRIGATPQLWVRSLDDPMAKPLAGTDGASYPFWSPESNEIAFLSQGKLKKVYMVGGPPQILCDASRNLYGGTWNADGVVLFAGALDTGILQVSAGGGRPIQVTRLDASRQEFGHWFPQFLPDGKHFLYNTRAPLEQSGIYVASLDGKTSKRLLPGARFDATVAWAPPGHLLFLEGTTLMAQPFDLEKLEITGRPAPVAQPVASASSGYAAFSASRTGVLAYHSGDVLSGRLSWFDRSGTSLGSLEPPADYIDFRLSPDEKRVAAARVDPQTNRPDIWILDLSRGTDSRFTTGPLIEANANWSPDGERILFRSNNNNGANEFVIKPASGGQEEIIFGLAEQQAVPETNIPVPSDWSADGRFVVFSTVARDLWALPMGAAPGTDGKPVRLVQSEFDEIHPNLSPDGRWLAYSSNETGRFEVYVRQFLGPDGRLRSGTGAGKWQVSTRGGYEPRWRPDGKELYYISADHKLMAVSVSGGDSFQAGIPQALFALRIPTEVSLYRSHYLPTRDGRRFLVNTLEHEPVPSPITVVLNWSPAVKP